MSNLIDIWNKNKRAREDAESWNDLPNGRKYSAVETFEISAAHSKAPMLVRAGQQVHSGTNYWETGQEFNYAILDYIVANWEEHYPKIIKIMAEKEQKSLSECQAFIDRMQISIDGSK